MKMSSFFFFGVFFLIYGLINFYIGLRGWQFFGRQIPFLNVKIYWIVFWFLALSYLLARGMNKCFPVTVSNSLNLIGSYWMAAMMYLLLLFFIVDAVRLADRVFHFIPNGLKQNSAYIFSAGICIFMLVAGTLIYGWWNARHPVIQHYDININKPAGDLKTLHIAFVSDLHLGNLVGKDRLEKMVTLINGLQPDIVLLGGDIIDEDNRPFADQNMGDAFRKLKTKYGVYGVLGNHEYYGRDLDTTVKYLKDAGIHMLMDDSVKVADSFYIVGRKDRTVEQNFGGKRLGVEELMKTVNKSLPVILMDHQPFHLEDAQKQGVDLQLSGHTHRGQLFPNNLITRKVYELDWGILKKGDTNYIVSSGYGTWGPPIRTGSNSEIVDIIVRFK